MGATASLLRAAAQSGDEDEVRRILADKSDEEVRGLLAAVAPHNGKTVLHYAASNGHSDIIRFLIEAGADPNVAQAPRIPRPRRLYGRTPVVLAAKHKHSDAVVTLAQLGADPDAAVGVGYHVLAMAIQAGDATSVLALLNAGANPRLAEPSTKLEPVELAASAGSAELVALLLDYGASPDAAHGVKHEAPLHAAARLGNAKMTNSLLMYGANPDIAMDGGVTPLGIAIDKRSAAVVRALLAGGANPATIGSPTSGNAPKLPPLLQAAASGFADAVCDLVRCGAPLDAVRASDGSTALHIAAAAGLLPAVEALLTYGAAIEAQRADGRTALHCAVASGHEDIVLALCRAGAAANARDSKASTAAHVFTHDNPALIRALLTYGADANAIDGDNNCPAGIALRDSRASTFALLLPLTTPALLQPLFHRSVDDRSLDAVRAMLSAQRVAVVDVDDACGRVRSHRRDAEMAHADVVHDLVGLTADLAVATAAHDAARNHAAAVAADLKRTRDEDAKCKGEARAKHAHLVAEYEAAKARGGAGSATATATPGAKPDAARRSSESVAVDRPPAPFTWKPDPSIASLESAVTAARTAVSAALLRTQELKARADGAEQHRARLEADIARDTAMETLLTSMTVPADRSALSFDVLPVEVPPPRVIRVVEPLPVPQRRLAVTAAQRKFGAADRKQPSSAVNGRVAVATTTTPGAKSASSKSRG